MQGFVHMPSLAGATTWIGSEPFGPEELRGHVVLVDFWTLTCINWLRTAPYVRAWAQAYRDDGLVVLGVHTPEFAFEHEVDLVRRAVKERSIDHPVVVDNDYAIWHAFANHYWPALYFVDRAGVIRDQHFGEGRYSGSERLLQRLLGVERRMSPVRATGVEADADWSTLRSPETYLGYARSERFASPEGAELDGVRTYSSPQRLRLNEWALTGDWVVQGDAVHLVRGPGTLAYRFHARDAHLVLFADEGLRLPYDVRLDGESPGPSHGVDVDADGRGTVDEARLHQLIRAHDEVRERTLEVTFRGPGVRAYVLTFG